MPALHTVVPYRNRSHPLGATVVAILVSYHA